jgi:hypothetical protein
MNVMLGLVVGLLLQARSAEVPASLLAAAGTDPRTFVSILTHVGVPAGLEIRESSDQLPSSSPRLWDPEQWTAERVAQQNKVPLPQIVAAFNQQHGDYKAAVLDGVLVVRPAERRVAYLDGHGPTGQLHAAGLMSLAETVFAPLDARLDKPGGRAGSRIGPIGVDVDYGDGLDLVVEAWDRNVLDILNEVVRNAPGHSWIVVTSDGDPAHILRAGFFHRYMTGSYLVVGH